jgi:formate--tetrahydrofolate ligase
MPTDAEIARAAALRPIAEIASKLGLEADDLHPYGREIAKVDLSVLGRPRRRSGAPRLILVSAINAHPGRRGKDDHQHRPRPGPRAAGRVGLPGAARALPRALHGHEGGSNRLRIDPRRILWRRVMDMNDRALRNVVVGLGGAKEGVPRETGFDITAASEVMAMRISPTAAAA